MYGFYDVSAEEDKEKMKKRITSIFLAVMLCGCTQASSASGSSAKASEAPAEHTAEASSSASFDIYETAMQGISVPDNYTAGIQRSYTMTFGNDEGQGVYQMDGVIAIQDDSHARISQNIWSDGMQSVIDGYYEEGRLYNTYNNVSYYEDMDFSSLKETMLVPLDPAVIKEGQVSSFTQSEECCAEIFTMELNSTGAKELLDQRYDIYGFKDYENYQVESGTITQKLQDGYLIQEISEFHASLTSNGIPVQVECSTSAGYTDIGMTAVETTAEQEEAFAAYVNYKDIDTSRISDADIEADTPGSDAEETFRKRLLSRLSYTQESEDVYKSEFNTNESYTVDFANHQFIYTNYSSSYVYNWKGDNGGFGNTCSYDFGNGTYTDDCDASVIDMIQKVKDYFVMELYYCGLSLDDLQGRE